MQREEQSGQDARGPQSGWEMGVSRIALPVPSPIRSRSMGDEIPGLGDEIPVSGEGDALPSARGQGSAGLFLK